MISVSRETLGSSLLAVWLAGNGRKAPFTGSLLAVTAESTASGWSLYFNHRNNDMKYLGQASAQTLVWVRGHNQGQGHEGAGSQRPLDFWSMVCAAEHPVDS